MRREFILPEQDTEYLDSLSYEWETVISGGNWVFIHEYPVPDGYNYNKVCAALKIEGGYPISQIDMIYFDPHLQLKNGKIIGALASQPIDGKNWQRWSRHRTGQNPWRPGLDDISTHLQMVENWLERETIK